MWINEGSNITIDKEPGGIVINAYNVGLGDSKNIFPVQITSHGSNNSYKCNVYDKKDGNVIFEGKTLTIYNIDGSLIIPDDTWLLAFLNPDNEYETEYEINIDGMDELSIPNITDADRYMIYDASEKVYKKTKSDHRLKVSIDDIIPNYLEEKITVNSSGCGMKLEVLNPAGNERIEISAKVKNSIEIYGDYIQLENDELTPSNEKYYGTDDGGLKGFHALPEDTNKVLVSADDTTPNYLEEKILVESAITKTIETDGADENIKLDITNDGIEDKHINSNVAGDGIGQDTNGALEVNVDNHTLEIATNQVKVKASGIGSSEVDEDDFDTVTVITGASLSGGNLVFSTTVLKVLRDDGAGSSITITGTECP